MGSDLLHRHGPLAECGSRSAAYGEKPVDNEVKIAIFASLKVQRLEKKDNSYDRYLSDEISKSKLRKVHLTFGISVLIVFLLTGQYMDKYHNHMVGVPDGIRLLYRTRHIFILLSGLTHLGIGAYFTYGLQLWRRVLQLVGSGLVFLSSLLFIVAFFYEPGLRDLYTPLSHRGTYCIAAGVLLHVLSCIGQKSEPTAG